MTSAAIKTYKITPTKQHEVEKRVSMKMSRNT
jgi:hypothetical protein